MQDDEIIELFGPLAAAIHRTVREFVDPRTGQRGASALAPHLGAQRPGTLSNKANPTMDHQLTLVESLQVQLVAVDFRILHAYAGQLMHTAYPHPAPTSTGDIALLEAYCLYHEAVGDKARAIRRALADQRITPTEVADIRAAFDAMVRHGLGLINRIEALAQ